MSLRECLESHPDNENLLYLTDSETTLQAINKWIEGGSKLSLAKTSDTDILGVIIVKLQRRVKAKTATLLIKVKAHHGCPLNEEADIRAEMGRMKQEQEKTWSTSTSRTIYQLKGVCDPLTGDTTRIGAKRLIGIEDPLEKCQETSLEYDIKERNDNSGPHPRIVYFAEGVCQ